MVEKPQRKAVFNFDDLSLAVIAQPPERFYAETFNIKRNILNVASPQADFCLMNQQATMLVCLLPVKKGLQFHLILKIKCSLF